MPALAAKPTPSAFEQRAAYEQELLVGALLVQLGWRKGGEGWRCMGIAAGARREGLDLRAVEEGWREPTQAAQSWEGSRTGRQGGTQRKGVV